MKILLTCSAALVLSSFIFTNQGNNEILDGKTYEVVITKEDNKKKEIPMKDNLIFKDGTFNTSYFMKLSGFPASVYAATIDQKTGITTFKSQSQSKHKDNMAWVGKINGDHVEGTVKVFIKKTKAIEEYSFTGNLRKKNIPINVIKDTVQTPLDTVKAPK